MYCVSSRKSIGILLLTTFAFILIANIFSSQQAQASKRLFRYFVSSNYAGYWAGRGTILSDSGETEKLKCKTTYFLSKSGNKLKQNLRCASPSYNIRARSIYSTKGNVITGNWHEQKFNIKGIVSGKSHGNRMNLLVKGQHITATMSIVVNRCSQVISIKPVKAAIKIIKIKFGRC